VPIIKQATPVHLERLSKATHPLVGSQQPKTHLYGPVTAPLSFTISCRSAGHVGRFYHFSFPVTCGRASASRPGGWLNRKNVTCPKLGASTLGNKPGPQPCSLLVTSQNVPLPAKAEASKPSTLGVQPALFPADIGSSVVQGFGSRERRCAMPLRIRQFGLDG
jgi:hypothetical protein